MNVLKFVREPVSAAGDRGRKDAANSPTSVFVEDVSVIHDYYR